MGGAPALSPAPDADESDAIVPPDDADDAIGEDDDDLALDRTTSDELEAG